MTSRDMANTAPGGRSAHSEPAPSVLVDVLMFGVIAAVLGWIVHQAQEWTAPIHEVVTIDLAPTALPGYALRSLGRGFAAYAVSLIFTLIYGTILARSRRLERILLPLLDILQGIPVLGFLPGLVLGLVALFPRSNVGLELACIIMIFTGQVWNMTFAYFGAVRSVPEELRNVARVNRFTPRQWFQNVEFSSSVIPLVWNSMVSMAGGWFFLTINEAFTLGDSDFRLAGIGSYMSVAIQRGDTTAMLWAVVTMVLMILLTDQLLWRPLVAWSQRFKLEESEQADRPRSFVLDLISRSWVSNWFARRRRDRLQRALGAVDPVALGRRLVTVESGGGVPAVQSRRRALGAVVQWASGLGALAIVGIGSLKLFDLLRAVTGPEWVTVSGSLGLSFFRTTVALLLSVAWTLPVGIWIGRRPRMKQLLSPIVQVAASFPAPMIFPLATQLVLGAGIGFSSGCTLLMILGSQWYLLFNIIAGASALPNEMNEVSGVYGLKGLTRWLKVDLPGVFPSLVTGLVTAAGGAWNATIVSEYVKFQDRTLVAPGLGSLISEATVHKNFSLLAASVLAMSVALVILNRFVWKRLYRLGSTRFSLNG